MAILYADDAATSALGAANTVASLTKAADPTQKLFLFSVSASYDVAARGWFTITVAGVVRFRRRVIDAADWEFAPLRLPANVAVVFALAAAAGAIGSVSATFTDVAA